MKNNKKIKRARRTRKEKDYQKLQNEMRKNKARLNNEKSPSYESCFYYQDLI
jgi:hypothetical protein